MAHRPVPACQNRYGARPPAGSARATPGDVAVIEIRLLGPPQVLRDGVPVRFDTRKALAVLARLALAGGPRPRDAVADLLWPDQDLAHARGALRRTLSTIRSALGPDCVVAGRDHVALAPGLDVDVLRFRGLAAQSKFEEAAEAAGGDLLEGFVVRDAPGFETWVEGEAHAVRQELVAVLARLSADREAAGDLAGALRVVRRWLALEPLQEPAHQATIRLLAGTGDRAGALHQYRECVRTLSRELGVPPLQETTALYEAVSAGTTSTAAGPASSRPPDPAPTPRPVPFVGRDAELRRLRDELARARDGGRVVLVRGEAGIGKTRLVEELVAAARAAGGVALVGRGYQDESALAYGPVLDLVRARLDQDPAALDALPPAARDDVARLLGTLREVPAGEPGPGEQTRFLGSVWEALRLAASAGDGPGVLVVDDAHLADEATLALLGFGVRRPARHPLLVLLTWRSPHDHPLLRTLAAAVRDGHGAVVELEPLDLDAVGRITRSVRPDAGDPDVVARLHGTTQGVPLLLLEYLGSVDPRDHEWDVPTGVRELVRGRLDRVSETARQVLTAAAVIGRSFEPPVVQAVSGRSEEETADAVDALVAHGLVRESGAAYDFGHDQVRVVAYDDAGTARRRLLHGRAADALAATPAAAARHLGLAGRTADAAAAHVAAAEQARAVYANASAAEHLRAALALDPPEPSALHAALGDLHVLDGGYRAAVTSYETAAASARPERLADLEHRLGQVHHRRGDDALATVHLEAALHATPDDRPADRARITADLSVSRLATGDVDGATGLAAGALALAERSGDLAARGQAHNLLGMLATTRSALDDARRHLETSRELADRLDDVGARVAVLNNLALVQRAAGDLDAATALTRAALDLCTTQGDRHREAALHNNLADLLHARGEDEEAMTHLKAAVAVFAEVGAEDEPRPQVWRLVRW